MCNFSLLFFCLLLLLLESVSDPAGKSIQVGFMLFDSEGTASRQYYLLPKEWDFTCLIIFNARRRWRPLAFKW